MLFGETALTVLVMLLYGIPGYILVKVKAVKPESISAFAKALLFVYQPCLTLYSFQKVTFSIELLKNMGIFIGLSAAMQLGFLLFFYFLLRKKYSDVKYRIFTVATTFGNVGFMGVPLLEALLPQYPEAVAFSSVFIISMNLICWTFGSYIITGNKKFMSVKKLVLNPPVLTLLVALPLFFARITLPAPILNGVTVAAKTTAPLCMLILGMRFATVKKKEFFIDKLVYVTSAIKLLVFPMLGFLLTHFLPIDYGMKATLFILCCCPTASVVLNLSEIYENGQRFAANVVLMSTILTIITIPLLLLIL